MTRAASAPSPVLDVRGLVVRRDQPILHGLDWTVRPREHWVVLGPNGCGKTSLLGALTGYLVPTSGTIQVLGATFGRSDWRELRKRIGFVSNSLIRRIEPEETALEVVASGLDAMLNLWHPPGPQLRRASLALLRRWGCGALADRPWGVLSQGERQRVLIARALIGRPPLLLLDEPCAGLDPVARRLLLDAIEREARRPRGPAFVLITHHIEEITPAFTHALLLRAGRRVASGRIASTLSEETLAETFAAPVRLVRRSRPRRFALEVAAPR
jgi:iron complex transport system ATP-binding protein